MFGYGGYFCPDEFTCGSPVDYGLSLELDGVPYDPGLQYGLSSFDHIGQAIMAVF